MAQSDFQINVHELPETGRPLSFCRDADWAQSILLDQIFSVHGDVSFDGYAKRLGDSVVLSLDVNVPLSFLCSRCGSDTKFEYSHKINHLFVRSQSNKIQIPVDIDLDAELDITEGVSSSFDAEPTVVGAFASALPVYPLCDNQCVVEGADTKNETPSIDPRLAPLAAIRAALDATEATTSPTNEPA